MSTTLVPSSDLARNVACSTASGRQITSLGTTSMRRTKRYLAALAGPKPQAHRTPSSRRSR